jgi:ribonucleoside-triphosphate reductase
MVFANWRLSEAPKGREFHPFYTNSTHLPVNGTTDIFDALDHQDELQICYTGGTAFHAYLGESPQTQGR